MTIAVAALATWGFICAAGATKLLLHRYETARAARADVQRRATVIAAQTNMRLIPRGETRP